MDISFSFFVVDYFDSIISKVQDIKRFGFAKIDGVVEEFNELLWKYHRRTLKICTFLIGRINKLKENLKSHIRYFYHKKSSEELIYL